MTKIIEQWLLFKYIEGQFTPLSKPFKTKAAAKKARTLIVSRSTAESPTKSISLAGIAAVNFQAGVNAILQSATLVTNQLILFVNTQPGFVTGYGKQPCDVLIRRDQSSHLKGTA